MRVLTRTLVNTSEDHYLLRLELAVNPAAAASALCDAGAYPVTAGGYYPPLNSETTDAAAVVYYSRAGLATPEVPTPGFAGDWHFASLGSGGSPDRPVSGSLGNVCRLIVVGDGTLDVDTSDASAGAAGTWTLNHRVPGDPNLTVDDSGAFTVGAALVINVVTHMGTRCVHMIDLSSTGPSGADGYSFAGATWTPA